MTTCTEQRSHLTFSLPEGLRHCATCETMSAEEACFCCDRPTFDGPLSGFCLHAIPVTSCSYQICRELEARRRRDAARAAAEADAVPHAIAEALVSADADAA